MSHRKRCYEVMNQKMDCNISAGFDKFRNTLVILMVSNTIYNI